MLHKLLHVGNENTSGLVWYRETAATTFFKSLYIISLDVQASEEIQRTGVKWKDAIIWVAEYKMVGREHS